jgi:hypothetical protein
MRGQTPLSESICPRAALARQSTVVDTRQDHIAFGKLDCSYHEVVVQILVLSVGYPFSRTRPGVAGI